MNDLVDKWLSSLKIQHYQPATIQTYYQSLQAFLIFLQDKALDDVQKIQRTHISDYLAKRIDKDNISKNTAQQELTVLRQFFKWLIKENLITENPTQTHKIKRTPRALPNLIDVDVLQALLEQPAPQDNKQQILWQRDRAMLELLYGSGLRVSELIGLNLADIDISQKILHIVGKGDKTRLVPLGEKAWQALQDYLPVRQDWLKQTSQSAVFISKSKQRLTTRSVQLRIKYHAKRANIAQEMYPHLLRHCFASHILASSGDLRGVQELLGHENIATTQIYTHLDFSHLAKIYDKAHPRAKKS